MALLVTAEDDDDLRRVMARSLERAGHTVVATRDGAEALAAAREHHPDAIVTDVEMPRMTGLELCHAVRQDEALRHVPVLVVSGSIDPHDPRAAIAGVTAILPKPFSPRELLEQLGDLLAHASQRHS